MFRTLVALSFAALLVSACECGAPGTACKQMQDCAGNPQPYCANALQVCVDCLEDSHCQAGFVCSPDGKCEAGCRNESDRCQLGQFCKAGQGCVECVTDAECGPGRLCSATNTCVTGCSQANPVCPVGQVCSVGQGQCVECATSADCKNPSRPVCSQAAQACVECLGNGDCHDPSKPLCDIASHTCATCLTDVQCPAGQVCKADACVPGCSPTHACPTGLMCNPANSQCVECLSDTQCTTVGLTKCDLSKHTCEQCLPGPNDNCPTGQYCRTDQVCEQGCKSNVDCPSGVCQADHSCSVCTKDEQCAAGNVCSSGTCIAACDKTHACGPGKDCCAGHCADTKVDQFNCGACNVACSPSATCCNSACVSLNTNANCGACGVTCGANQACCANACKATNTLTDCGGCGIKCGVDQFCDGTTCHDQVFPQFCVNKKVYAILDGIANDNAATNTLVSTIQANCSTQTLVQTGPQTNPAWVDQTTGALLLGGGSTIVTAGGPYPNKPVKWLEKTKAATKVFYRSNGVDTHYFTRRADNVDLVTRAQTYCTATPRNDVFMVELVTDPSSSTLALIAYGLCGGGYGTATGAWYWANVMLPNTANYPDSWYLVEWKDVNADNMPTATDTFTILSHGR